MAFKSKLLTTAAIPLIALTWMGPVAATPMVRADAQVEAQSMVIKVQSDEEELLKQQKQERRERRQQRNQQDQGAAQDDGEQVKPRRKKNAEAQQEQNQQQMQQSQDAEPVKPRRKKNVEAQQEQPVQNVPADDSQPVQPRKKRQQAQEEQQMQDQQMQQSQDDAEPVKPRRKKQQAQDEQQMQEQQQSGDEQQTKPRRKKNAEAQQDEQNSNSSIEEIQTKPKRQKNADAEDQADRPKRDKQKEVIAEDPAKTADTIELPVENGAAVLDSDKDADKRGTNRLERKREREEGKLARIPRSDRDAQAGFKDRNDVRIEPVLREKGERVTGFKGYDYDGGRRIGRDDDFRIIIDIGGRPIVRDDDRYRLGRHGETRYERLSNGRIREVVIRPDGDRIVTVRNRWGEIIRRSRIDSRDREIVIFYSPYLEQGRDRLYLVDAGANLPPMRLRVPLRDYIADVSSEPDRDYVEFLEQPPVEPVERVYSIDEVKYSARIRDKVRRIDLDTITFDTGSAEIDMGQASSLKRVGAAIKEILDRDPGETFMIEGHTDAVGSDESNLVLSDQRAESVANVLSDVFDIPAENLVTQGYGEQYLKVDTDGPERMNRRVTIRRITSLVRPVAANEE